MSDGYLGDERLNELARLCMALLREVWVMRDRQIVLEKLLADRGVIDAGLIEGFEPEARDEERIRFEVDRMIRRVFASTFRNGPPDLDELTKRVHEELAEEARLQGSEGAEA